MSDEVMSGEMLERYARGEASVPIPTFTRDVYRHLLARLDAAERERDALEEALSRIALIRPLGDINTAVRTRSLVMRMEEIAIAAVVKLDARAALTANHSAPVVEE